MPNIKKFSYHLGNLIYIHFFFLLSIYITMPPRKDTLKWKEYQANAPKKARKTKIKLSNQDRQILEGYFQQNNFPSTEQINQLLEQLNSYTANEIRVWFRNRRAKLRREQEQEQSTTQRMVNSYY